MHVKTRTLAAPSQSSAFARPAFAVALFVLLALSLVMLFPRPASAGLGAAGNSVPAASLVGEGQMTFLGFAIFDAELYAPQGQYKPSAPFALKLTYLRSFKGTAIAAETAKQMRRQGMKDVAKLEVWTDQMNRIFPNVSKGQSLTGVRDRAGNTVFYSGSKAIGTIKDPEFTKRFFAIWLGQNTQNPDLRNRLVGARS
ncbi:chalcone isomerase family protein [Roseibium suaedae]|uniref:Chalcone isomerase-like n=1 Tax=Roseibium suaedae TaxID=735517 RepID=A0A1M7HJ20_9HYPH|nr:chalcone isomerase family protein [Roseibium suaedae]SHM28531.1 Chalcone isomerase-like [Roseibium suaedae]